MVGDLISYHRPDDIREALVCLVLYHQGGELGVESVEYHHVAVAHLVEDRYHLALAEVGIGCGVYQAYVVYQAVVADRHVSQRGVADARVACKALGNLDFLAEVPQTYAPEELYIIYIVAAEILVHKDSRPILCRTPLLQECVYLMFVQTSHRYGMK